MQEKHEEDPDGIRRNAEVIFAAGVSRDGAPPNLWKERTSYAVEILPSYTPAN